MNKLTKLIITILFLIVLVLIILNYNQKENYKNNIKINNIDFTDYINELIQAERMAITKEINIEWLDENNNSKINHNYIYKYKMDLENMYLVGTIQKNNGNLIPIYYLKDNGKYYYYQEKDWIRENNTAISYEDEIFINDYKSIIDLLKNIEPQVEKKDNTYKVTIKEDILKKYIQIFSNENDPSLVEELLIENNKISTDDILIYITVTNNNIEEILFDFSMIHKELKNYTCYYSIYFDEIYDYDQFEVNIPTNVLASLF